MDTKAKSGRRFITPVLEPGMTVGTAFKAIAMAALAQVAGNAEDLRQSPSAEVVHQLRVGVRRLQGTISAFKPIVDFRAERRGCRFGLGAGQLVLDMLQLLEELIDWVSPGPRGLLEGRRADAGLDRAKIDIARPRQGQGSHRFPRLGLAERGEFHTG